MSRLNPASSAGQPGARRVPSAREAYVCCAGLVVWLAVTAFFVGLRAEHFFLALLVAALFFTSGFTRRLAVALLPFLVFGISYDWMNIVPNYEVNSVDTSGIYNAEKSIFGIETMRYGLLTPNEFFALHRYPWADILAGLFYLCWVPVPIIFGLYLYFHHRPADYLHFALVFLLVNLTGFAVYYIHPAAPPWYAAIHGFEAVPGTPGETAGLGAFDSMTGTKIFHTLYARNANVFAAVPSLHSAYTLVAFIYSLKGRTPLAWKIGLAIVTIGIWISAVYTSHHYIIDVIAGIGCALFGFFIFEYLFMRIPGFRRFIDRYVSYITLRKK